MFEINLFIPISACFSSVKFLEDISLFFWTSGYVSSG